MKHLLNRPDMVAASTQQDMLDVLNRGAIIEEEEFDFPFCQLGFNVQEPTGTLRPMKYEELVAAIKVTLRKRTTAWSIDVKPVKIECKLKTVYDHNHPAYKNDLLDDRAAQIADAITRTPGAIGFKFELHDVVVGTLSAGVLPSASLFIYIAKDELPEDECVSLKTSIRYRKI